MPLLTLSWDVTKYEKPEPQTFIDLLRTWELDFYDTGVGQLYVMSAGKKSPFYLVLVDEMNDLKVPSNHATGFDVYLYHAGEPFESGLEYYMENLQGINHYVVVEQFEVVVQQFIAWVTSGQAQRDWNEEQGQ